MMMDNQTDILARLDAMRVQEETLRCRNYFRRSDIPQESRRTMATWLQQMQTTLNLSSETVWIAMSYFDRYLSSGKGQWSQAALTDKRQFQLAAIASFYLAVKTYEPVVLGLDMLVAICRGTYDESDFVAMEKDILSALGWRVAVHTPLDVARDLVELLHVDAMTSEHLLRSCQELVEGATADFYFSCHAPSIVGLGCLVKSLVAADHGAVWSRLSELCPRELSSSEVVEVVRHLPTPSFTCTSDVILKRTSMLRSSTVSLSDGTTSSPVSVIQTARQA